MKKLGLILATISMICLGAQAQPQVGQGAASSAKDASNSGWSWVIGVVTTALILATGGAASAVSSDTSTFNHNH